MLVPISIIVVSGFAFLVILGALRLVTDLMAMSRQAPVKSPPRARLVQAPGFLAQTLHQPPAATLFPTKILQPACVSPGLP
jgi:hypothetical protein